MSAREEGWLDVTEVTPTRLVGRLPERQLLQRLVADVAAGRSRALVLRGEDGVGKSALLRHLTGELTGWRILSVQAGPAECGVSYSALHRLCSPLLGQLDALSVPQREALERSFGLRPGPAAEPALTALATYALVVNAAKDYPLACVVDDAHWLDPASASAQSYLARRLSAERVALLCASRPTADGDPLLQLPAMRMTGLAVPDARRLLLDKLVGPLDGSVAARIVAECRGNPRVLLGLPATWGTAELAGGFAVSDGQQVPPPLRRRWSERIRALPPETRLLVVAAAAEPLGDPLLLRRAAEALGTVLDAVSPAVDAGLLQVHSRVLFAHPLIRDVAYGSCTADERARAHGALAAATDPDADADRRAWHRAWATRAADDSVASALEAAAAQAHARGGLAAGAAFLTRATELTADARIRSRRAVDAAAANLEAGSFDIARTMLDVARAHRADEPLAAHIALVEARLALAEVGGNEATLALQQAARRLEPVERRLACETYVDALTAAAFQSVPHEPGGLRETARAARAVLPTLAATGTAGLLLSALASFAETGTSTSHCRTALRAVSEDSERGELRWLWHGTLLAFNTWDDRTARLLANRHVRVCRTTGALSQLPLALGAAAIMAMLDGELSTASSVLAAGRTTGRALGVDGDPPAALLVHAWRGRAQDRVVVDDGRELAAARGDGHLLAMADYAQAVLRNGSGDRTEALSAALRAVVEHDFLASNWCWAELVEAAARAGRQDLAEEGVHELAHRTRGAGSDWASGVHARSAALVSTGVAAEDAYRRAIDHLRRTKLRLELARTHLLYGEWLRHVDRRSDARIELHTAYDAFLAMGMEAFAARARAELSLSGGAVRPLAGEQDALTAQEEQIAGLARDGLSNPEIGALLFLSSRTVEWHLRKVFTKLGISSRRELRRALGAPA